VIANVTPEMTKRKDRMKQELSTRLQTEVQSIAKEVEVVKKSTDMEVTNSLRNVESVCDGMYKSIDGYKSRLMPA
jgi:hypothetical protein